MNWLRSGSILRFLRVFISAISAGKKDFCKKKEFCGKKSSSVRADALIDGGGYPRKAQKLPQKALMLFMRFWNNELANVGIYSALSAGKTFLRKKKISGGKTLDPDRKSLESVVCFTYFFSPAGTYFVP